MAAPAHKVDLDQQVFNVGCMLVILAVMVFIAFIAGNVGKIFTEHTATVGVALQLTRSGVPWWVPKLACDARFGEIQNAADLEGCTVGPRKVTCASGLPLTDADHANGESAAWCMEVTFIYKPQNLPGAEWRQYPPGVVWLVKKRGRWLALSPGEGEGRFPGPACPCTARH